MRKPPSYSCNPDPDARLSVMQSHSLRILAMEPYFGGSHRAFLDGWIAHSHLEWTVLSLPPHKWKWRLRHSAVTFAKNLTKLLRDSGGDRSTDSIAGRDLPPFDAVFCSDMLNLAEWRGLAPRVVREVPNIVFFHENQLTYPVQHPDERDLHFGFSNLTTALAADAVWFNSGFHRDTFLNAAQKLMRRMPDHAPIDAVNSIRRKSFVFAPGIEIIPRASGRSNAPRPMRILWAARWEYDKNPALFFDALSAFRENGRRRFEVSVLGESFREYPKIFDSAKEQFADEIVHWGYIESRSEFEQAVRSADIILSTAKHEFFGIGVAEAMSAGVFPLTPNALAYPEVIGRCCVPGTIENHFHDSTSTGIVSRLKELDDRLQVKGTVWRNQSDQEQMIRSIEDFFGWNFHAPRLDAALIETTQRYASESRE